MYLPIELDNDALKQYLRLKSAEARWHKHHLSFTDTDIQNLHVLRAEFGQKLHGAVSFAVDFAMLAPSQLERARKEIPDLFEGEG